VYIVCISWNHKEVIVFLIYVRYINYYLTPMLAHFVLGTKT